jgi:hypothetical protein
MKSVYIFLLLILISCNAFAEVTSKLSEAIQKKQVIVNMAGAKQDTSFQGEYSSYYGPCMALEISNTTNEVMNLNLEYGYKLVPVDSSLQTMMVTQTLIAKLQPKQKKNYRIYAMCTEASDGSPSPDKIFKMGNRFGGNILSLAELLNRKKYQGNAAQEALWCLTDNHNIQSIFSDDTVMMYELRRFVVKAKGIAMDKIYSASTNESFKEPITTFTTRTVYSGSLSYSFGRTSKVMIALFDEDDKMKQVYVNNEIQREYTYKYEIGSDEMENKKHYLRMFRDGRLEQEISILPH